MYQKRKMTHQNQAKRSTNFYQKLRWAYACFPKANLCDSPTSLALVFVYCRQKATFTNLITGQSNGARTQIIIVTVTKTSDFI